jgi:hypothetical protein
LDSGNKWAGWGRKEWLQRGAAGDGGRAGQTPAFRFTASQADERRQAGSRAEFSKPEVIAILKPYYDTLEEKVEVKLHGAATGVVKPR